MVEFDHDLLRKWLYFVNQERYKVAIHFKSQQLTGIFNVFEISFIKVLKFDLRRIFA